MRIPRIFHHQPLETGKIVSLEEKAAHHLIHVLRFKLGYQLHLFDGSGNEFLARIHSINKHDVNVSIENSVSVIPESPLKIHLGQSISRSAKMDMAIQKAVELGVSEITPLITEFCAIKLADQQLKKRYSHWQSVIINACEQCGRAQLPSLNDPSPLSTWLKNSFQGLSLVLDPNSKESIPTLQQTASHLTLLIGPEGGLSQTEINLAKQNHFKSIRLGPRILRTETATLAAIAILQGYWGDMN